MRKIILCLLLAISLYAGETAVYQVWISSFSPSENSPRDFSDFATGLHMKCKDLPQAVQKYRLIERISGDVVMFDISAKVIPQVQGAISSKKIKYIGSYKWDSRGYKRDDEDWQKLRMFFEGINKSTYSVETSTP